MKFCIALLALMLLPHKGSLAATYEIAPDGSGDFPTIQAAVDHAVDGDIIELLSGVFQGPGNRGINYLGKEIVIRSQQGDPELCTIDCGGADIGVFFGNGEGPDAVLDGITIRNGRHLQVGGIYIFCSSPTIRNCVLSDNVCTHGIGAGGVMAVSSSALLVDCVFRDNLSALGGGGFFCDGEIAPTLQRCIFFGNTVASGPFFSGGAIICHSCSPTIDGCLIYDNFSESGAGGLLIVDSSPTLNGCTIVANEGDPAGGVHVGVFTSHPIFENTIVALNHGVSFDCSGATPSLTCCDVWGNEGGDWIDCIEEQFGIAGNFSLDPLFCDLLGDDYTLRTDSPCLPGNHPDGWECGLIGALEEGCEPPTPVVETSWGGLKIGYR